MGKFTQKKIGDVREILTSYFSDKRRAETTARNQSRNCLRSLAVKYYLPCASLKLPYEPKKAESKLRSVLSQVNGEEEYW